MRAFKHAAITDKRDIFYVKIFRENSHLLCNSFCINGISFEHSNSNRKPVWACQQTNNNLLFPFFLVAIVAPISKFIFVPFKVGTGHII